MLRVERLHYRKGPVPILRGISLSVGEGEFVAVLGPNGAGKSTLLKHAAGVLTPPPGTVFLQGDDRAYLPPREAARRVAYVPQVRDADIPFTAREVVAQARYPFLSVWRPTTRRDREQVTEAMEGVGILRFADRSFRSLSGGEQQKVLIAAAFAQDAPLLLLDEPTTFLDPAFQEEIFLLLVRICRESRRALLVVTHEVNRALLSADRIVALRDGETVCEGTPDEIAREERLEEIYGTRFLLVRHPEAGRAVIVPRGGEAE